jgi:hypothetical protein
LIIRKEQLAFLAEQQGHSYALRLTKFLQLQFPDAGQEPTDKLLPEVAAQIKNAQNYGLLTEQDIAHYVISAWLLGKNFDHEFPAAQEVLAAPISAEMKVHFLEHWTQQIFAELEGES